MNRNPLDQLRALRLRRAQERTRQRDTMNPYDVDDTQPLVLGSRREREVLPDPAPSRGRRRVVMGVAVGAVAGGFVALGLPALAGGSADPAAGGAAAIGRADSSPSVRPSSPATGTTPGTGRSHPAKPAAGAPACGAGAGGPRAPLPGHRGNRSSRAQGAAHGPRGQVDRPTPAKGAAKPPIAHKGHVKPPEARPDRDSKPGPPSQPGGASAPSSPTADTR